MVENLSAISTLCPTLGIYDQCPQRLNKNPVT